jgi:hypothetical protein
MQVGAACLVSDQTNRAVRLRSFRVSHRRHPDRSLFVKYAKGASLPFASDSQWIPAAPPLASHHHSPRTPLHECNTARQIFTTMVMQWMMRC